MIMRLMGALCVPILALSLATGARAVTLGPDFVAAGAGPAGGLDIRALAATAAVDDVLPKIESAFAVSPGLYGSSQSIPASRQGNGDRKPGEYVVTRGFYSFFQPVALSVTLDGRLLGLRRSASDPAGEIGAEAAVVPLPAAFWLMLSSLGLLAVVRGRQSGGRAGKSLADF